MTSIFLVEDHAIFAQSLQRMLHEKGHLDVVEIAGSAEEALEKIPNLNVDLVLVDVSLPQQSGISLVLFLHEKYPNLPCVMLSGHLSPHYVRSSLEAGARGYLVKDRAKYSIGIRRFIGGNYGSRNYVACDKKSCGWSG
jgi:DNA-binding NarL/FixJ family response regulator